MLSTIMLGDIDLRIQQADVLIQNGNSIEGMQALDDVSERIEQLDLCSSADVKEKLLTRKEACAQILMRGTKNHNKQPTCGTLAYDGQDGFDIERLLLPADKDIYLEDLVGMNEAKLTLLQAVLLPKLLGVPKSCCWKGVLLYGPSGVGKSRIIRALNNSIAKTTNANLTFVNVPLSTVLGPWHGDTEKNLTALFEACAKKKNLILCIDEVDSISCERGNDKQQGQINISNHFLTLLDGLAGSCPFVFIGMTNKPQKIDSAFYRRFQKLIFVDLPEVDERENILRTLMHRVQPPIMCVNIDFKRLALDTDGYSGDDLSAVITEAFQQTQCHAFSVTTLQEIESGQTLEFPDVVKNKKFQPITHDDLENARRVCGPKNQDDVVKECRKFSQKFLTQKFIYDEVQGDCECITLPEVQERPLAAVGNAVYGCFKFCFGD